MSSTSFDIVSSSPTETAAIGAALAAWLQNGDVLLLHGDLGAGKTTLAKGIAKALGIDAVVSSPSFSLVNTYDTGSAVQVSNLFHLDLYRLRGEEDLESIGFEDFAAPDNGATVVEWPERAGGALPDRYVLIEIKPIGTDRRHLRFTAVPDDGSWTVRFADVRDRFGVAAD